MASQVYALAGQTIIHTGEVRIITLDFTNQVPAGVTPSAPTSAMVNLATGATVTLTDSPTLAGNIVTQIVRGAELTAGDAFRLALGLTASASVLNEGIGVQCPW